MKNRIIVSGLFVAGIFFIICTTFSVGKENSNEQNILKSYKEQNGFLPNPLVLMSQQPGVLTGFMEYGTEILEDGPLSEKERFLVTLAAAVALKSPNCIRAHITKATRAGATQEEITQVILIAGLIGNTSTLQVAGEIVIDDSQLTNIK